MTLQLELDDLAVAFSSSRTIRFTSAKWTFQPERPVIIVRGENASGKTTLLNVLSGHVKPLSGRALLGSTRLSGKGPVWATRCGVVRGFQVPLLCNDLKVWENVALPIHDETWWHQLTPVRRVVADLLAAADLQSFTDASTGELSFGQRRIVELIRMSLQVSQGGKRLVLLDEPFAGLDNNHRAHATHFIRQIAAAGTPTLLVEHDSKLGDLSDFSLEARLRLRDEHACVVGEATPVNGGAPGDREC